MSEIESDHGSRTAAKDVFGLKGQKSLFAEVCPSSLKWSYMALFADRRRQDGHPRQAWPFRSHTARRSAFTQSHLGTHPPRAHLSGVPDNFHRRASAAVLGSSSSISFSFITPLGRARLKPCLRKRGLERGLALHLRPVSNYIHLKHWHIWL